MKHPFKNPKTLDDMLILYQSGWDIQMLMRIYKCDRSSIVWQLQKHGLYRPVEREESEPLFKREGLNEGHGYRWYLEHNYCSLK